MGDVLLRSFVCGRCICTGLWPHGSRLAASTMVGAAGLESCFAKLALGRPRDVSPCVKEVRWRGLGPSSLCFMRFPPVGWTASVCHRRVLPRATRSVASPPGFGSSAGRGWTPLFRPSPPPLPLAAGSVLESVQICSQFSREFGSIRAQAAFADSPAYPHPSAPRRRCVGC